MVWCLCQYADDDDDDDSITFVFSILRNTTNQVSSSRWRTLKKSGRARGYEPNVEELWVRVTVNQEHLQDNTLFTSHATSRAFCST
jgi:hypothetical protein